MERGRVPEQSMQGEIIGTMRRGNQEVDGFRRRKKIKDNEEKKMEGTSTWHMEENCEGDQNLSEALELGEKRKTQ